MAHSGWIGVDLDGTLAEYYGWTGGGIGAPVGPMLARVKAWLAEGIEVRIMTARVAGQPNPFKADDPEAYCDVDAQRNLIQDWTEEHLGVRLPVTNQKDLRMIELWDDRAVQVIPNRGERADGQP